MSSYNHSIIEKKWQRIWKEKKLFKTQKDRSKPKYYILDMFPYPSGAGLHVGHVTGYTATDILARYKRQLGFNVLHPMGWDSFGLPAEQYAVRTGTHPAITTKANIDTYRRQLESLGFSYDWDSAFATSDPSYYKWTQWIFTKLYERGLAYQAEVYVNFCPALGTVLANEEVENGFSVEGGFPIERKPLKQWILKITAYAERLLEDLNLLDWPEYLKKMQRNWIGRSEGAEIYFQEISTKEIISIYTTMPQTIFGTTFLVLAPEHPLVSKITTNECHYFVEEYKQMAAKKSDMDRTELSKEKTGVFTGAFAISPADGSKIPIWIGDYVLMTYGTGSVMGVPISDIRDFEFAKKYHLPIKPIVDPDIKGHPEEIPEDMTAQNLRMEVLGGKRRWGKEGTLINSKHGSLHLDGLSFQDGMKEICRWLEEHKKGKKSIQYKLRDWLFSRQRYWGEPIPILHLEDGSQRILSLDELPLNPPVLEDYKPIGDGRSPLAKAVDWVKITDSKTGKRAFRETHTMPQWAGSCWYYLRFCDPHNQEKAWDKNAESYWMPVDLYIGGVEHAVLHLLYARFWHKVLYDCGLVSTLEPFQKLRNQGLVTAFAYKVPGGGYVSEEEVAQEEEGEGYIYKKTGQGVLKSLEKMSKSKLNGVSPDEMIDEFGADSLRLYEMFMGPFDKEKLWNTDAVSGCRRFLNRFYELVFSDKIVDEDDERALKIAHRLVYGAQQDIENMLFNTAIAKMMEFINAFTNLPCYSKNALKMAVQVLYPFAPHIAEECWEKLGGKESLTYTPFPKVNPKYLVDEMITYVFQVNGKVRGKVDLSPNQTEKDVLEAAKKDPNVDRFLRGAEIAKIIYIPNKLLNIVTK